MGVRRTRRIGRTEYAWGNEFTPDGKYIANTWQGEFPRQNLCSDGYERTSPVTAFPPNGYGVHDMIGNVWEWTSDFYSQQHAADAPKACCIPQNPRGAEEDSFDPRQPQSEFRKRFSRAARICVRRTTAAAIGPPRVTRSQSIRPPTTSDFDASFESRRASDRSIGRGLEPINLARRNVAVVGLTVPRSTRGASP